MSNVIRGPVYVVRDNIDTDQIIPAQYLNLVPTIPEEYDKLGSYALAGLPRDQYPVRYVAEGQTQTVHSIVIVGANVSSGAAPVHPPPMPAPAGTEATTGPH